MFSCIFDFCRNISIILNLLEIIKGLSTLVLIIVIVLVVKRIFRILQKEREVDKRIRETRARMARLVIEMKESMSDIETRVETRTSITQTLSEVFTGTLGETLSIHFTSAKDSFHMIPNTGKTSENVGKSVPEAEAPVEETIVAQNIHEVSSEIPKGKKTRAMSMEERWAAFDKKRAMKNTA